MYADFVKDVAPIAIALTEKGLNSWSYHGKNMSSHDKLKAVDTWCPEDSNIQVHRSGKLSVDEIITGIIFC